MDKIRKEKEAAEYQECTFQPKLSSDMKAQPARGQSKSPVKNQKAQKLLKRRQRQNGGGASPSPAKASEYTGGQQGAIGEENMQSAGNEQAGEYYSQSPGPSGDDMDLIALAAEPMPGGPTSPAATYQEPAPQDTNGFEANDASAPPPASSPVVQKGWSQETNEPQTYVEKKLEMLRQDVSGQGQTQSQVQSATRQHQGTGGAFPMVDEQQADGSTAAYGDAGALTSSIGLVTPEKLAEVEDILKEEKQQWVQRLKKENSTLVGVLADVRAAKKKLLSEYEKLDLERNKFYAMQAEIQDNELEDLLAALPLGARSLAATKGKEALSLHGLVSKLILAQRAHQKVTMDRLLKGAAVIEQAYISDPGNTDAIKTGLNQIRDVVMYSDLSNFFENQWGQNDASDILERRGIALSSMVPVGYDQAGDDGMGTEGGGGADVGGDMAGALKKLSAKNAALKNNLNMLRAKNKKAKAAGGGITSGAGTDAVFLESGSKAQTRKTATRMEEMGLTKNPEQPKFSAVPPEWQYVSMRCLKDAARKILEAEPRAEGMPEPLMVELVDFIADELKDAFAPMLLPVVKAQMGEFEEGQATAQVSLIIAAPAMQVEIAPLAMMALTYMQSRADMS